MKRRDFIALTGGGLGLVPFAPRVPAQSMPLIGVLGSTSRAGWAKFLSAFHEGLAEAGFAEGRNVAIEYRWADNRVERLPALAADLVGRQVATLVPMGGSVAVRAARDATPSIPVVFAIGGDPIKLGFVTSLNRPGANLTGISFLLNALVSKRLQMIRDLVPTARRIGLLVNPRNPSAALDTGDVQAAAGSLGLEMIVANASGEGELATAFAHFAGQQVAALLVLPDPLFISQRSSVVTLAARHALPAAYALREDVEEGGLMSYGPSISDAYRHLGVYVGRVLKGQNPAEMPVERAIRLETVINLRTAKALGLDVAPSILAQADEIVE